MSIVSYKNKEIIYTLVSVSTVRPSVLGRWKAVTDSLSLFFIFILHDHEHEQVQTQNFFEYKIDPVYLISHENKLMSDRNFPHYIYHLTHIPFNSVS